MLTIERGGASTALDDGSLCYLVGYDGIGLAPIHRLLDRGPLQHGATDRGWLLDPRSFAIVVRITAASRRDLYEKRDQILDLVAPGSDALAVRWDLTEPGDPWVRQIDAAAVATMYDLPEGFAQKIAIQFLAAAPWFYDPATEAILFALGGGSGALTIPHAVPHYVGVSVIDATQPVANEGNLDAYPHTVRITGPITNPVLTNETTGEVLDFTGTTIAGGDWYQLDLRPEAKTCVDSGGTNRIDKLTNDSDLATWHLQPGTNSLHAEGTAATEASKIEIGFYHLYAGA